MRALFESWVLMLFAVPGGPSRAQPSADIQVLVYDYSDLSGRALNDAEGEAARILLIAGIRTYWASGPTRLGEQGSFSVRRFQRSLPRLAVQILPAKMAKRDGLPYGDCGLARLGNDDFGTVALIDSSCVEQIVERTLELRDRVLGGVIAHELGHLLLGRSSHTGTGIMRASWSTDDCLRLRQGRLLFTLDQGTRMRQRIAYMKRTATSVPDTISQALP